MAVCCLLYYPCMDLQVEKLIYGGDGLARLAADEKGRRRPVFLPFVIDGERVEAHFTEEKPGFARGALDRVLAPSAYRVAPGCPYFQACGGCHYQQMSYEHQLAAKAEILKETLRRTAKLELPVELQVHASPPWEYRNRTRMRLHGDPFALGYYRFGSHELLPVEKCPISSPLINRAMAAVWELGRAGKLKGDLAELEFFADHDDAHLLLELYANRGGEELQASAEALSDALPEVAGVAVFGTPASAGAAKSRKPAEPRLLGIAGDDSLRYEVGEFTYRVSAGSFFQTNRHLVGKMVELAVGDHEGHRALDLYAGTGLFSLPLHERFDEVTAVESAPASLADLEENSAPGIEAIRSDTAAFLARQKVKADLVLVDPPRAGLGDRVAAALGKSGAPRLVYVSCDPATLARDLALLLQSGYRIEQAHLVDLFPQTFHLESIFHLAR